MKRITIDHVIAAVCLLLGTAVLILTQSFPQGAASTIRLPGPSFFPNLLAIILIIIGIYEAVAGYLSGRNAGENRPVNILTSLKDPKSVTIFIILAMLIFFIFFLKILGFFVTSFIFLFVILHRLGVTWWKDLITSLAFLLIVYIIFVEIFTTRFPSGILI